MKQILAIVLMSILASSIASAYGWASNVPCFYVVVHNVCAHWNKVNVSYSILNSSDKKYEVVTLKAIATWNEQFEKYDIPLKFIKSKKFKNADIPIRIIKNVGEVCGKWTAAGCAVINTSNGVFKDVELFMESEFCLPIKVRGSKVTVDVCNATSEEDFYSVALHELGHLLGLDHAEKENYRKPVDLMASKLHKDMQISELDIKQLKQIYNSTESKIAYLQNNDPDDGYSNSEIIYVGKLYQREDCVAFNIFLKNKDSLPVQFVLFYTPQPYEKYANIDHPYNNFKSEVKLNLPPRQDYVLQVCDTAGISSEVNASLWVFSRPPERQFSAIESDEL